MKVTCDILRYSRPLVVTVSFCMGGHWEVAREIVYPRRALHSEFSANVHIEHATFQGFSLEKFCFQGKLRIKYLASGEEGDTSRVWSSDFI